MVPVRAMVRVFGTTFVVSMLVVLGCPNGQYPTTPFRCQPSSSAPDSRCPGPGGTSYQCCSDDPATLDLDNLDELALPPYHTLAGSDSGSGTPLFSADRNDASFSGMCIKVGSVAPSYALSGGCPIPCNPSWDRPSIDIVCGSEAHCCETTEIEASDCVLDSDLGDAGCWRPARGEDIVGLGGLDATSWSTAEHATPQDPGFQGCEAFVDGLSNDALQAAGVTAEEVRLACVRRLGVANQRGFCIGGPGVAGCPLSQPSYRDACEQLNDGEGRAGCG